MCIFGKPKVPSTPQVSQAPAPALPPPSPTTVEPSTSQVGEDARKKKLEQLRFGFASTIRTKRGIFGKSPELASTLYGGQNKLGA